MTPDTPDLDPDDLDLRLRDLRRRQKHAHRMEHPDPADPDYDLENIQAHGWRVGYSWTQPAPKRGLS